MITKRIFLALTLAAIVAISANSARAQSTDVESRTAQPTSQGGILDILEQIKLAQSQQLEGSWISTVTLALPPGVPSVPPFTTYGSFARGGVFIGSDRTRPFSNPQHGVWEHLRDNEFAATFIQDDFDAMGVFQGVLKVRVRITITGKDEIVGVANGEQHDAKGNLVFNVCSTLKGRRVKLEPLSEQCQSITPPQ
jgi:hypothetical protein